MYIGTINAEIPYSLEEVCEFIIFFQEVEIATSCECHYGKEDMCEVELHDLVLPHNLVLPHDLVL